VIRTKKSVINARAISKRMIFTRKEKKGFGGHYYCIVSKNKKKIVWGRGRNELI